LLASSQPGSKRGRAGQSRRGHVDEASQWPSRKVHRSDVSSSQRFVEFADGDPDIRSFPTIPQHIRPSQKGEPPEHFAFGEVLSVAQLSADALCEMFVVGHRSSNREWTLIGAADAAREVAGPD
jgi:hypothetical protein